MKIPLHLVCSHRSNAHSKVSTKWKMQYQHLTSFSCICSQFNKAYTLNICNNYTQIVLKLNVIEHSWEKTVFSMGITYMYCFKTIHNGDKVTASTFKGRTVKGSQWDGFFPFPKTVAHDCLRISKRSPIYLSPSFP